MKKLTRILLMLLISLSVIGASAYLTISKESAYVNKIQSGITEVKFTDESEAITVTNLFPTSKEYAIKNNNYYTFTLKNNGSVDMNCTVSIPDEDYLNEFLPASSNGSLKVLIAEIANTEETTIMESLDNAEINSLYTLKNDNAYIGIKNVLISAHSSKTYVVLPYIELAASLENAQNKKATFKFQLQATQSTYKDTTWQNDWTYSIVDVSGVYGILLNSYNGSETTYKVPSSAMIEGVSYPTAIGDGSGSTTAPSLSTGTITNLSFEDGVIMKSGAYLFSKDTNLKSIDLTGVDTSGVTDMQRMFFTCTSLTDLNISTLDTSNLTSLLSFVSGCSKLKTIDISSFDTSKVTNMGYMFSQCTQLTTIYIGEGWTTANVPVKRSNNMFNNTKKLLNWNSSYTDKTKAYVGDDGYLSYK